MNKLKFRQPIFDSEGVFQSFQTWEVGESLKYSVEYNQKSQQYIGLFDKNGKEYCIGDIVLDNNGGVGVLCWLYARISIASGEIHNYHAVDSVEIYELANFKIVGNIYENPNLESLN